MLMPRKEKVIKSRICYFPCPPLHGVLKTKWSLLRAISSLPREEELREKRRNKWLQWHSLSILQWDSTSYPITSSQHSQYHKEGALSSTQYFATCNFGYTPGKLIAAESWLILFVICCKFTKMRHAEAFPRILKDVLSTLFILGNTKANKYQIVIIEIWNYHLLFCSSTWWLHLQRR